MPTTKTRINISLSKDMKSALFRLARQEHIPHATKAARLLETALELEEDRAWELSAASRDTKNAQYVSHEKAWK